MTPQFSIVIPAYNRANVVAQALESVLSQDLPAAAEVIVVDDGSTDATAAVVRSYQSQGVSLLAHPSNRGVGPARNWGVRAARGEWIIFLDTDNRLRPGALARLTLLVADLDAQIGGLFAASQSADGLRNMSDDGLEGRLDYAAYLRRPMHERLPIMRREALLRHPFPEPKNSRRECGTYNMLSLLKGGWDVLAISDVLQDYDNSGGDRLSGRTYLRHNAGELVDCHSSVLDDFGDDICSANRPWYLFLLHKTSVYSFLSRQPRQGWRWWMRAARAQPWHWRNLPLAIFGILPHQARLLLWEHLM